MQPIDVPPSWEILPIPRYVDYGGTEEFLVLGKVAIIRREGSPYHTLRDANTELVGESTVSEEELTGILSKSGVKQVESLPDDLASYDGYDTLILLGSSEHNRQTAAFFNTMTLSFGNWDDPRTAEDDFSDWPDLGTEGYILKVGRANGINVIILAGYDRDDTEEKFCGAGTFYAMQSLRQLIVAEGGVVKVKTAEIADAPLLAIRGCYSAFDSSEDRQWRDIDMMARIKVNQNVYWYGNGMAGYNVEAASKFRYPWRPEQLAAFGKFGKYCREHFITMVFCMNPDHYHVDWAAAKTFDGSRKDPLHYDPDYEVEPEFKKMWANLGYEVKSDIDILAAKFAQLNEAVPGCILQMMNEDDGFGLFNEADQKRFNTVTGDPKQDAVNYGRARAQFLAALYRRIKELCPDSAELMPMIPPGQLGYQLVLDRDEANSREFLDSMTATLDELGLLNRMPIITTGGATAAEVVTNKKIEDFKRWGNDCPVLVHDNNFGRGFHVGAYETDPEGPRSPHQVNKEYPAGYRDRELYKHLLGVLFNGAAEQQVLNWCQGQYMWNMLALDREKINALATRKVTTEESYPLVKAFYEEFDNPACYLPDNPPPYRLKPVSDTVVFPPLDEDGWTYDITYTEAMRLECQRLRDKLERLMPQLEEKWQSPFEKPSSLKWLGGAARNFCVVYLANGYVGGWDDGTSLKKLSGDDLRELFLDALDVQGRFFNGPEEVPGRTTVTHHFYSGSLRYLYTNGAFKPSPATPEEADFYVDFWADGLAEYFSEAVDAIVPGEVSNDDPHLAAGWGGVEEADGERFRTATGEAILNVNVTGERRLLVRAKIGTGATSVTDGTTVTFAAGEWAFGDSVCKRRWIYWLLPDGAGIDALIIRPEKPVRMYAVEFYAQKD